MVYQAGVTNGVTYAIPNRTAPCGLFYNKTLFDKAGAAYPTDRMDFDKFLETCKALTIPASSTALVSRPPRATRPML
jgi:multiple sugar transport system substrate-binding protein